MYNSHFRFILFNPILPGVFDQRDLQRGGSKNIPLSNS